VVATPVVMDVPLQTDQHGKLRVGNTRVLLELVIHAFQQGETADRIQQEIEAGYTPETLALRARLRALRGD
jgi:hypothetical protein